MHIQIQIFFFFIYTYIVWKQGAGWKSNYIPLLGTWSTFATTHALHAYLNHTYFCWHWFFFCFIVIQTKCDFHNSLKLKGWCHQPGIQSVLVSGYENYFCFSWSLRILTVESVYLILKVVSDGYLVAAYNSNKPEASWKIECATYERYKWGM